MWFTVAVTDGYWGVLWKENYVGWIAQEPWLKAMAESLIKFKWARGGHLYHNMTSVLGFPKWGWLVGDIGQNGQNCMKITKLTFLGQNSGGAWGDKPIFQVVGKILHSPH